MPMTRKPLVSYRNHSTCSIDDYYTDFAVIWERDRTERSVFDLWLHVVDHAARVASALRRQLPPQVIDEISDTTVWLMSFIAHCASTKNRFDMNFKFEQLPSDLIWNKYPGLCPGCFDSWIISLLNLSTEDAPKRKLELYESTINEAIEQRAEIYHSPTPCTCLVRVTTHTKDQDIILTLRTELDRFRLMYADALRERGKKLVGISELEEMFDIIYANVHRVQTLESITFHLLEEIGEATQAIKDCYTFDNSREPFTPQLFRLRKQRMLEELGDIFSWVYTVAIKLRSTYFKLAQEYLASITRRSDLPKSFSFADILWSKYGMTSDGENWNSLNCPGCSCAPCECGRDLKIAWEVQHKESEGGRVRVIEEQVERDLVFISYSHLDAKWLDRFQTVLKPLIRNQTLSLWEDRKIRAGQRWREEIESALSRTKVAVLLVSANFLASDFIAEKELPPLLDAAQSKGTKIIWIPISASLYKETELALYQSAHDPSRPLEALSNAECNRVLVKICEIVKESL